VRRFRRPRLCWHQFVAVVCSRGIPPSFGRSHDGTRTGPAYTPGRHHDTRAGGGADLKPDRVETPSARQSPAHKRIFCRTRLPHYRFALPQLELLPHTRNLSRALGCCKRMPCRSGPGGEIYTFQLGLAAYLAILAPTTSQSASTIQSGEYTPPLAGNVSQWSPPFRIVDATEGMRG
jgi:hypothetical protein